MYGKKYWIWYIKLVKKEGLFCKLSAWFKYGMVDISSIHYQCISVFNSKLPLQWHGHCRQNWSLCSWSSGLSLAVCAVCLMIAKCNLHAWEPRTKRVTVRCNSIMPQHSALLPDMLGNRCLTMLGWILNCANFFTSSLSNGCFKNVC